jgi:hypothetical protein
MISHYIDTVTRAIANAERRESNLTGFHMAVEGMSSIKGRHLLNNLLRLQPRVDRTRYLEVGSWKGSTLCAATYGHDIEAVAIDDFSQFATTTFGVDRRHPRDAVQQNLALSRLFSKPQFDAAIIDGDCFKQDPAKLGLFDVYLYDGEHTYEAHYKAFTHFAPALQDTFIAVIDDYRNLPEDGTHQATEKAFADLGWKAIETWYLWEECDGTDWGRQANGWWNGLRVSVVSKGGAA